jgi:hypothetical protein
MIIKDFAPCPKFPPEARKELASKDKFKGTYR